MAPSHDGKSTVPYAEYLLDPAFEPAVGFSIVDQQPMSFGSKLASLGKAAVQETQRNAHLASLKTKIEKLKLVDVHKAQYALGKKAYELRIAAEKFGGEYVEIATIEKFIVEKRAGVPADHGASNVQLLKGAAISVKMKAEAEGLELKLKQMFVVLGSGVESIDEAVGLENEIVAARSVHSQILELEKEYTTLSQDHAAQGELKNLSASLATEAGATSKAAWVGGVGAFKRRSVQMLAFGLVLICVILFFVSHWSHKPVSAPVEDVLTEELQAAFTDNKQDLFNRIHPVGTATSVKVHDVSVVWKNGVRTNLEKDILQFTVRFTIYWAGPITKDGYTKATQVFDEESNRWIGGQVISTNGVTNTEVKSGAINFGIGFLQGYLQQQQQQQ